MLDDTIIIDRIINGEDVHVEIEGETDVALLELKDWLAQFCEVRPNMYALPKGGYKITLRLNTSRRGLQERTLIAGTLQSSPLRVELLNSR